MIADTGEEVPWKEIVKAFEYDKGSYVVLEPEDIKSAATENHETVEIAAFVDAAEIGFRMRSCGRCRRGSATRARWFKPDFVIEVGSRGIGRNGLLRQPSVKAVRLDKKAADLIDGAAKVKATAASVAAVTHPDRVVFPEDGYTKQQVANYYASVMPHLLPAIVDRPLSLIRCPSGTGAACFFQKHEISGVDQVDRVRLKEGSDVRPAARAIHGHLASMRLASFVRTSGGKGLHVVVPLNPAVPWPRAKAFAQSFALVFAKIQPD